MVVVNSHVLIMSTLAHVLDRLKSIDSRLIDIEDAVMVDDLSDVDVDLDDDSEIDVDDGTAEAIAARSERREPRFDD